MRIKEFVFGFFLLVFATPVSAESAVADWKVLVKQAREASSKNDMPYALHKLRKAWFALPAQDLNSEPHKEVKSAMIAVLKHHNLRYVRRAAERMQDEYSMEQINSLLKQREFNSSDYEYSVEMLADGSISLFLNGLDEPPSGMPVCQHYLSQLQKEQKKEFNAQWPSQNEAWKKANEASKQALLARMPIIVKPGSAKYDELLSLCQPIQPGEKKQKTGFDVSGFVPLGMSQSPDI